MSFQEIKNLLNSIEKESKKLLENANNIKDLYKIKAIFLGKKGNLRSIMRKLPYLNAESKLYIGKRVNTLKKNIQNTIIDKENLFQLININKNSLKEKIDVTLTGQGIQIGNLHPISHIQNLIEKIFFHMGFINISGPEMEDEYHNFEALNIPKNHPARDLHDTFYLSNGFLLRTQTSNVQIHIMDKEKPPFRIITSGRVYRRDLDITHTPMFHQMEGLWIEKDINFPNLKYVIIEFLQNFFTKNIKIRFRPSYFPFTEPSAEVDIQCKNCQSYGCQVCKNSGWLEVLGCGMVHPNVLKNVGINPQKISGFAFGLGIERLAMLFYGIEDIRWFFKNQKSFLDQF